MRIWASLLILGAQLGCAATLPDPSPGAAEGAVSAPLLTTGARLPDVPLLTLDDHAAQLDATLGGRVALVSFWATWCESCAAEFDALNRLDERAKQSGAVVVGIAVGESRAKAAEFSKRRQLRYLQLVDEEFKLADALGQKRLPATLVINRKGHVVFKGGAIDEAALAAFRAALGG